MSSVSWQSIGYVYSIQRNYAEKEVCDSIENSLECHFKNFRFYYKAGGEALKNFKWQWNIIRGGFEKINLTDVNKMDGGKIEGGTLIISYDSPSK